MCETLQLNWKLAPATKDKEVKVKRNAEGRNKRKMGSKYALRTVQKNKTSEPKKRGPKPRPKPLPMSKYRRKTANLRERQRMGEINTAFDKLKEKIPSLAIIAKDNHHSRCEKMTKINILHVAINYIRALENILDTGDAGVNVYGTAVVQSPFLPLPNEANDEVKSEVKVKRTKVKKVGVRHRGHRKDRQVSTSSSSSNSEDSGIVEEEEEEDEDEDEDGNEFCPDWTELTSTLEFPPANVINRPTSPNILSPAIKGTLDTLLTQLSKANNNDNKALNRQISGLSDYFAGELANVDVVNDLNLESSLAGNEFGEISFIHEDPFQMIF